MMNMVEEILALVRKLKKHPNPFHTLKIFVWYANINFKLPTLMAEKKHKHVTAII